MLVVSRCIVEFIVIGNETNKTILDIKGKQNRIGFSAPENVDVHLEWIYKRIQASRGKRIARDMQPCKSRTAEPASRDNLGISIQ